MSSIVQVIKTPNTYIIFYSTYCGYSTNAVELLKSSKSQYNGYIIEDLKGGMHGLLRDLSKTSEFTGYRDSHTTRPIIFYNGKFIGGCSELKKIIKK